MTLANEKALEEALRMAAEEPAHRPLFYRFLLDSVVYALSPSDASRTGISRIEAGEKITILNWEKTDGSPVVPFFTSMEALRAAIEQESAFLKLPARALFEMTKGSCLVLNPKLQYSKEFLPDEIEALLASGL